MMDEARIITVDVAVPPDGDPRAWVALSQDPASDAVVTTVALRRHEGEADALVLARAAMALAKHAEAIADGRADPRPRVN